MRRFDLQTDSTKTFGGGADTAASNGTRVNTGNSATDNVFGAWTEIIASAETNANMIAVNVIGGTPFTNIGRRFHMNVGVGISGAERVVLEGVSFRCDSGGSDDMILPCQIRRGDRVAVQLACPVDAQRAWIVINAWEQHGMSPMSVVHSTYIEAGRNANGDSPALAMPTADNTWGPWTQIAASTEDRIDHIFGALYSLDRVTGQGDETILMQLGIGAGGVESPVMEPIEILFSSADTWTGINQYPVSIPKSSRLSMRFASDNIAAHTAYTMGFFWTGIKGG